MDRELLKNLLVVAILIAVGFLAFFLSERSKDNLSIDILKFSGSVESVEDGIITMQGIYDGPPGTIPESLSSNRTFSFKADSTTQFEKREINLPSRESLTSAGATSGTFSLKDLPQTEGVGSLNDIKESLLRGVTTAEVDFSSSIYNVENPVASSVSYIILARPSLPL